MSAEVPPDDKEAPEEKTVSEENTEKNIDPRAVKIALYGFVFVLLACMISLKPYLPSALIHNFAKIDDYKIFSNRVVKAGGPPQPWPMAEKQNPGPSAKTQVLLDDLDTTALLMLENGKVVYEKYFNEGGREEISGSFSMAKTIVGLLTGFAIQDGAIRSVNDRIGTFIPEWEDTPAANIKVKDLLTMSSGLNWDESYNNPFSITTEAYYGKNLLFTTLRQRSIAEPGKKFIYQSGTSQLLGLVVERATNRHLAQYASEKLWTPLGAEKDALWSLDHEDGTEKAYCCFNATARDFARLGQFILNEGKWGNRQLLSKEYLAEMEAPNGLPNEKGTPVNYYGYQLWLLNTPQGVVPYARGILGQYIIVVPQKNRVVVRLGKKRGESIDHHPAEVHALAEWALE